MHLIVLKENFSKGLAIVEKGLSVRPQLPILSHIILEADKTQLKLSTTNLELGINYTLGAKIEQEGKTAVPGKLLIEFINSLSADKIDIKLEDTKLIVKSQKTQAQFAVSNPADFPTFPLVSPAQKALPLEKVKDAVLRSVFAASTDEARPVLTGVRIIINKGKLQLAATDGYRLSLEDVDVSASHEDDWHTILPAQSLLDVVRVATEVKATELAFNIINDKNQVVFILPNTHIFTRLIDGEFPNIEKIIPAGFKTKAIVDKDELTKSVKTTSLFARGAANIIKIKIEKDGLRLSANTPQVGEDEDFVEAHVEGEETEIAFNYRFLLDLLANFPDKDLLFESSGPLNPGVFKPLKSSPSFLHIIMPVRVQS